MFDEVTYHFIVSQFRRFQLLDLGFKSLVMFKVSRLLRSQCLQLSLSAACLLKETLQVKLIARVRELRPLFRFRVYVSVHIVVNSWPWIFGGDFVHANAGRAARSWTGSGCRSCCESCEQCQTGDCQHINIAYAVSSAGDGANLHVASSVPCGERPWCSAES